MPTAGLTLLAADCAPVTALAVGLETNVGRRKGKRRARRVAAEAFVRCSWRYPLKNHENLKSQASKRMLRISLFTLLLLSIGMATLKSTNESIENKMAKIYKNRETAVIEKNLEEKQKDLSFDYKEKDINGKLITRDQAISEELEAIESIIKVNSYKIEIKSIKIMDSGDVMVECIDTGDVTYKSDNGKLERGVAQSSQRDTWRQEENDLKMIFHEDISVNVIKKYDLSTNPDEQSKKSAI